MVLLLEEMEADYSEERDVWLTKGDIKLEVSVETLVRISRGKQSRVRLYWDRMEAFDAGITMVLSKKDARDMIEFYVENAELAEDDIGDRELYGTPDQIVEDYIEYLDESDSVTFKEYVQDVEDQFGNLNPGAVEVARIILEIDYNITDDMF